MPRRRTFGFTLAEVTVSMAIGSVLIIVISSLGVQQAQFSRAVGDLLATSAAVREATTILSLDLRGADPLQGDIPPGEARDTSIQFRFTVGTSVVCDTVSGALVLSPSGSGSPAVTSMLSAPLANDTLWLLVADTTEHWESHVVTSVSTMAAGQCATGTLVLSGAGLAAARTIVRVNPPVSGGALGMPVRITRPLRYSLYKSSDGLWYLGQRDWNSSTQRFNAIQPIVGPLLPPGPRSGIVLTYADSSGAAVPSASSNTRAIASIRVTARAQTAHVIKVPGLAVGANGLRVDSASAVVTLRSR